ncbi:FAD-dependent oxidoreductase [Myxococcota bacterium]|nr:FAD-dependent oxidoreductase [Myxococcota bacterium]
MTRITIDGQAYEVQAGETILDVARRAGLGERIPTLCHAPGLPPYTSCYLCVVEQEGLGKLIPACSTQPTDGAVIHTQTDRVEASRKTALELFMSNHPADCMAPCRRGCPAGVDVQRYLDLVRTGQHLEAVKTIRRNNPFPVVCGRVCVRVCEDSCRREILDEPIAINMVKRVATDYWVEHPYAEAPAASTGKRVAVVGGGPAGLTAAYYLRMMGHAVSVFEAKDKLGGMLRWGIPDYRLPQHLLDFEIQQILNLGVDVEVNARVGSPELPFDRIRDAFDAVYLAVGAQAGASARIKGEEHPNVLIGVDFLERVKNGEACQIQGKTVAVIGGGNTAVDAARTALRLGAASVMMLYRRTRAEMPANVEEIHACDHEGVDIRLLIAPLAVQADGPRLEGIVCQRMKLGEPDPSGRRRPVPVPDSEHLIPCDVIIGAIGQKVDLSGFMESKGQRLETHRWGSIKVDEYSFATTLEGVFAGGDAMDGEVVIDAIGHGHRAALSIDQFLKVGRAHRAPTPSERGLPFSARLENFGEVTAKDLPKMPPIKRAKQGELEVGARISTFEEVDLSLSEAEAVTEAQRCLACGCSAFEDCELRALCERYDLGEDISGQIIKHPIDASHPQINLDPNKCILCARCIRTCGEVMGLSILGLVNRGFEAVIAPSMGRPLVETACISCGNCVDACPTAALEFKALAQNRAPHPSPATQGADHCTLCGELCDVVLTENLWGHAIRPRRDERAGLQLLCELGRYGEVALIEPATPQARLKTPLLRDKATGALKPASWPEAIAKAAIGLKAAAAAHGRRAVLLSGGPDLSYEEAFALNALGAEINASVSSLYALSRGVDGHALDGLYGVTQSTASFEALEAAEVILVVGQDPMTLSPSGAARLRRAKRGGARIVDMTSRPNPVAQIADLSLNLKRGSSSLLFGWLLGQVLTRRKAHALYQMQAALSAIDEGRVLEACGVRREAVYALMELLCGAKRVVITYGQDAAGERAPDDLLTLALFTEVLGGASSGVVLVSEAPNLEGLRRAGLLMASTADRRMLDETLKAGGIRAALIMREDPDQDPGYAAALSGLDFLVVSDVTLTATAARADVVFPASVHWETGGTFIRSDRRIFKTAARVEAYTHHSNEALLGHLARAMDADTARMSAPPLNEGLSPRPQRLAWPIPVPRFAHPQGGGADLRARPLKQAPR